MNSVYRKIALLHHAGGGNLGDDAIIDTVIENIRARCPDAQIAIFSMNPADTQDRHGVTAFPIRRFRWSIGYGGNGNSRQPKNRFASIGNTLLRKVSSPFRELAFWALCFRRLLQFDLLVVSGGGQLTERGGAWSFPYALFAWAQIAKLARVRFIVLSVGAGPLRHPLSRFFVVGALAAADYVSFRDKPSRDLALEIGYRGACKVYPDSAYGARFKVQPPVLKKSQKLIVGLAPMLYPYCDPKELNPGDLRGIYEEFLSKLGTFTGELVDKEFSVQLFGSDIGTDPEAMQDLRDAVLSLHNHELALVAPVHSLQDLLEAMVGMDVVVTCRYHGVLLAHLLNKPVLAVAHHPKVTALMESLGLEQYCVDIQTFDPNQLMQKFESMLEHYGEIKAQMASALSVFQEQAASQYDALFRSVAAEQTVSGSGALVEPPGGEPLCE